MQMAAGAVGLTCQKLGEVEVFIDAGVADDMLITFNIVGAAKTDRLMELSVARQAARRRRRQRDRWCAASPRPGVRHGRDVPLLIECDTGFGRNGVQSPEAALDARALRHEHAAHPLRGAHDLPDQGRRHAAISCRARSQLFDGGRHRAAGRLGRRHAGARRRSADFPMITEHRAGTYVYNDVMMVTSGAATLGRLRHACARHRGQPPDRGPRHHRRRLEGADPRAVFRQGFRPRRRISRARSSPTFPRSTAWSTSRARPTSRRSAK